MSKTCVRYSVEDRGLFSFELGGLWDVRDESYHDLLITEAAKDFHSNHDGWEAGWPLVFNLHEPGSESKVIAQYKIDQEWEFDPCVTRIEKEAQK